MPYNANIPQPTDQFSQSQVDILGNFSAINTLIDVDHVDFNASGQGKHFRVSLPVQSPAPTFSAGDVGLYSFASPVTVQNELYINKVNQVSVTQIPATASILSTTSAPATGVSGWTYLPSGILIKWGNATVNSTGTPLQTVLFPTSANIPVFNGLMSVQVTTYTTGAIDPNTLVVLSTNTTYGATGFSAIATNRTTAAYTTATIQYLAIGY